MCFRGDLISHKRKAGNPSLSRAVFITEIDTTKLYFHWDVLTLAGQFLVFIHVIRQPR